MNSAGMHDSVLFEHGNPTVLCVCACVSAIAQHKTCLIHATEGERHVCARPARLVARIASTLRICASACSRLTSSLAGPEELQLVVHVRPLLAAHVLVQLRETRIGAGEHRERRRRLQLGAHTPRARPRAQ